MIQRQVHVQDLVDRLAEEPKKASLDAVIDDLFDGGLTQASRRARRVESGNRPPPPRYWDRALKPSHSRAAFLRAISCATE